MTTLVIAEHDNATIKGATLNTVTAAVACGGDVHVLIAGHNAGAAAQAAAQIAGVAKVIHADGDSLAHGLAGDGGRVRGEHHDVDGFGLQGLRGGNALGGRCIELAVQVFGDDQNLAHHSSPFCLSAATSSAASLTITPLLRLAGGA